MLDLILGYLLIIIILFSLNIGLILGYFKFDDKKNTVITMVIGIILLIIMAISSVLTINLLDYLSYVFILISIIIFAILFIYLKKNNLRLPLYIISGCTHIVLPIEGVFTVQLFVGNPFSNLDDRGCPII